MVISRESDYAIRILRVLADGEKHTIGSICETEHIPKPFGHKIAEKLQKKSMVRCEREKYGGCYLDCDLHQITLFDVLEAIDNECYLNLCLTPGYECPWEQSHTEACRVHRKLMVLQQKLEETTRSLDMYSLMFE